MATNVPSISWTEAGLVLPQETDILSGVQADQNAAFGGNLNLSLDTPQGQLAQSESAIIAAKNEEILNIVNQVDPDVADGFMQEAIGRIYFIRRRAAIATIVTCDCNGAEGAVIATGALIADVNGNLYACITGGTIQASGTISLDFQATVAGAIPAPADSVNRIYQAVPGWDSVNNPADGIIGSPIESRADFEYRRRASVAINAQGSMASIKSNVFALDNVLDVYAYENCTGAAVTIGTTSKSIAAHSIYVAVSGGDNTEIAQAIWRAKAPGSDYTGNTTISVTDESGYEYPYPTYSVTFQRPTSLSIKFAVQIVNNPKLPSDIIAQTKTAIVAAFNGTDGGSRARIGAEIVAGRFYAGIAAISPYVSILSVLLGTSTATLTNVTPGVDQAPTVTESDITVTLV